MSENVLSPKEMWARMKKNSDGLVPAITVDHENGEVLMMAYMNEEAFCLTCETGYMHYYSRSLEEGRDLGTFSESNLRKHRLRQGYSSIQDRPDRSSLPYRQQILLLHIT